MYHTIIIQYHEFRLCISAVIDLEIKKIIKLLIARATFIEKIVKRISRVS